MLVRFACLVVAAMLLAACSSEDEPPPRSPLEDTATPAGPAAPTGTATPSATTTPTDSPTPLATPSAPATPTPTGAEGNGQASPEQHLELATGNAIELMAEWLGAPATDLSVEIAEAVMWPDACLGLAQPGVACAAVLTPGFRIVLRDALGGLHRVHANDGGVMRWAGAAAVVGTVAGVEGSAVLLVDIEGDHAIPGGDTVFGDEITARDAPGSSYIAVAGPSGLREGDQVAVGLDADPNGGANPLIAWLVVLE